LPTQENEADQLLEQFCEDQMLAYANELLEDEKAMLEMMIEDHRES